MQFFYWNEKFEVGLPEIDRQHRILIDMINNLAAVMVEGGRLPDVQELFSRLMDYAASHFADEEEVLAASSLDEEDKVRHLNAHRGFVAKTREIMSRPDLLQAELSQQVLEFLTTWFISHILGLDMRLGRSLAGPEGERTQKTRFLHISPVERLLLGALTETERRFRLISDHAPVLIWVSDAAGVRGFFNRSWYEFLGIKQQAGVELDWADRIHPEDRERYLGKMRDLLADPKPSEAEYRLRNYAGNYRWFLERIVPRIDFDGSLLGFVASSTDVSEMKQAEALLTDSNEELEREVARRTEQLEQLMLTDPLTGIGNRRKVMRRLTEEVMRAHRYRRPLTVCFFDIDHFKRINDSYGHGVGDVVLSGIAEVLGAGLRDCDLLGRFGGEEFVIVLPETDLEEGLVVAERMREDVELTVFPDITKPLTVSGGLAQLRDGETAEDLLERSDKALYQAKRGGRNCCRKAP